MDFKDQIKNLATRVETLLPQIQTEEATKNALIMPFIQDSCNNAPFSAKKDILKKQ